MKLGKRNTVVWVGCLVMMVVIGLVLTACADNKKGAAPSPGESIAASKEPTAKAMEELKPYEVSLFLPGSPQKDQLAVEAKMAELLQDTVPNTTVKIHFLDWSAYQDKTNLMLQTGEAMDLVFAPEWYQFFSNTAKGAFLPLNDGSLADYGNLLDQYGQGIKSTIFPLYLEAPVVNGKLYAIPTNKEIATGRGFAFRKDIVEKYGLAVETVKDLQDIEPFIQTIAAKEPDIYPVYANKQDSVLDWLQDYGFQSLGSGTYIDRTAANSPVISVLDPAYYAIELKNARLLNNWYKDGRLNKTAPTTQEKLADMQAAGKVWFMSTTTSPGRAEALRMKNTSGKGPEFWEWIVVPIQEPLVTTAQATGSQIAIARSSKDPVRAMMVLDQLYTNKELINTFVFGLKDKHYTLVGDNKIKQIADSGYNSGASWMVGNQLNNYLLDHEADNKWEEYVRFNQTAEKSPLLGFVFNPDPVKTQVAAYNTIDSEFRDIIRTGSANPEEILQKRNDKLKRAGIDDIVKEMQKQLDGWKAANGK